MNQSIKLLAVVLFIALCTYSCTNNDKNPAPPTVADIPVKSWSPEDMRDIPALSHKRGLIKKSDKATPGYIMFHPSSGTSTFLMNLDGEIVHELKGELNSMLSYLTEDGRFVRAERDIDFPTFAAGGQSGRIREYSWDGEMTWDFKYATDKLLTHHDIALLPNGNILAIAYEVKTKEECIALGLAEENLPKDGLWFDKVIEIEPIRPEGGNIVWEWRMWDHLEQNIDDTKPNYNPEVNDPYRINLNPFIHPINMPQAQLDQMKQMDLMTANATVDNQGSDLTHLNAIYYNSEVDQIVLSSYHFGEVYIIDHSTSTAEAAGRTGGKYGHGGDLLYRWGNPQNYGVGDKNDRQLFHQHDVRWIPKGSPGEGNLLVFNNDRPGGSSKFSDIFEAMGALQRPNISIGEVDNYSSVFEIDIPEESDGNYTIATDKPYGPSEPVWTYTAPDKYSFYGAFVSNAHRLTNGNTFINSGPRGRFFEIDGKGEILWEYKNPYFQNYRLPDGTVPQPVGPFLFAQYRVTHIPVDHPAIKGKDLKPISPQPAVFVPKPPQH